ncbi:MAG: ABC transporter ATP-binding protein [Streptosporangiaceae bacterium]
MTRPDTEHAESGGHATGRPEPLLAARDLVRSFGSFRAVDGVSLDIAEGSMHAIIGPNGAGKTTLFRLLSGILRPTAGRLTLGGADLTGARPHVIARHGLAQSFQMTTIFPRLTVAESVQAAIIARDRRASSMLSFRHRRVLGEAMDLLGLVGLAGQADLQARVLSHGDQRALDVALALATRPRLLLLDEPTAGMSGAETARTMSLIAGLAQDEKLTVVFSEHDMDVVFGIAQHVTVLHQGRVIADGTAASVRADEQVMAVYLGGDDPGESD